MKDFLESRFLIVGGIKPTDGHFQDLCDAAHELVVWGVLATLVLIHPRTGGHRIDPGQFAEFFLREACAKAGLFETVSEHDGPY